MIQKLCELKSSKHLESIMKGIEPLLRHKRREILIMGDNYEDVNEERKEIVVKFMTSTPSQEELRKDLEGVILIVVEQTQKKTIEVEEKMVSEAPSAKVGKDTVMTESTPQVTISIDMMQVDCIRIILDILSRTMDNIFLEIC